MLLAVLACATTELMTSLGVPGAAPPGPGAPPPAEPKMPVKKEEPNFGVRTSSLPPCSQPTQIASGVWQADRGAAA